MTAVPFPTDVSYIQAGRDLEVEAIEPGRRSNEFSMAPSLDEADDLDESPIAFTPLDDIIEAEERPSILSRYLPHAQKAFSERHLVYPFVLSSRRDSLQIIPGARILAESCAELSRMVGKGSSDGQLAKEFEKRAATALHRLIGGWGVCIGAPRDNGMGPKRAVQAFRSLLTDEIGPYQAPKPPRNGDFGADAVWILGRTWGGPVVMFQAKNAGFSIRDIPTEFSRASDVLLEWFGKRINQHRAVISVFAVNTVFTRELKERAFESNGNQRGYHIIDAVDILHAETHPSEFFREMGSFQVM